MFSGEVWVLSYGGGLVILCGGREGLGTEGVYGYPRT